jgi:N-acetylglucosaminyldiphosphoundecaprenol N-acetyl-beta-D-mannosaminyltransferase
MVNILGVDLDTDIDKEKLDLKLGEFLSSNDKQRYIVTPNPEIILKAQKDEELFYILNKADLSLPDGFGLKLAGFLVSKKIKRFTGADALLQVLSLAEKKDLKVLVFNNKNGLSSFDDISSSLREKYPNLNFLIKNIEYGDNTLKKKKYFSLNLKKKGPLFSFIAKTEKKINEKIDFLFKDEIRDFSADILICNFGAPEQEKFVFHNLKNMPSVKLGMGIGGAIDFLTSKVKRAPFFMRFLGLEWLWRLILNPRRYKRICRAVFVFSFKFLKWRFINPFLYRKNVACFLYKREKASYTALDNKNKDVLDDYMVLLVERAENPGHWQLPQGGTDGEGIKRSGNRELSEELGTNKFVAEKAYKNVYKYKSSHRGRYGFKGQKQGLLITRFLGSDFDIKLNFWDHSSWKWVKASDLVESVYRTRKQATEVFLEKFKNYLNIK